MARRRLDDELERLDPKARITELETEARILRTQRDRETFFRAMRELAERIRQVRGRRRDEAS